MIIKIKKTSLLLPLFGNNNRQNKRQHYRRRRHHHHQHHPYVSPIIILLFRWILLIGILFSIAITSLLWTSQAFKYHIFLPSETSSISVSSSTITTNDVTQSSLRGNMQHHDKTVVDDNDFHWIVTNHKEETTHDWFEKLSTRLQCPYTSEDGLIDATTTTSNLSKPSYNHIPDANVWNILFEAYHHVVDPKNNIIHNNQYQKDAWHVPIEVRYDPVKGRGVYVIEDIKKDTLVWSAALNTVEYKTGEEFRAVLEYIIMNAPSLIPTIDGTTNLPMTIQPKDVVCDCLMWIDCTLDDYTQIIKDDDDDSMVDKYLICQTYDEGVLLNMYDKGTNIANLKDGDLTTDTEENQPKRGTPNLLPMKSLSYPSEKNVMISSICQIGDLIASQDIWAGEELLLDYGEYSHPEGWVYFGLDAL